MSTMNDTDSIELFSDAMKRAASAARQMATVTKDKSWTMIAIGFDNLRANGEKVYKTPTPSQSERVRLTDILVDKLALAQVSKEMQ